MWGVHLYLGHQFRQLHIDFRIQTHVRPRHQRDRQDQQGNQHTEYLNLTFDEVIYLMGGGVDTIHRLFICENNRKSTFLGNIFLHGKIQSNFLIYKGVYGLGVP